MNPFEKVVLNPFEKWVSVNFTGVEMPDPPEDWDRQNEFFYLIDGKQYRIPFARVPEEFKAITLLARMVS